jgi:flagellar hook-associated protein 1 FlgK
MSSLFGTLSIALSGLMAEQGALDATTNNVANANTPGFSRQRAVMVQADPITTGSLTYGSGVKLQRLESLRDPILELRIQDEAQQQGKLDAFESSMNQVQVMFSTSTGDIGTQLSNFFASLNQLSTSPADVSLRQAVITAASNLAGSFRNAADNLTRQRQNVDLDVSQSVQQVNVLTSQIATLNTQITAMENVQRDASAFIDQRGVLIKQLAGLIDVSSISSDHGLVLTTSNGTALVADGQSFALDVRTDPSGVQHIFSQGSDITAALSGGKISGLLEVRDQKIPALLSSLDTLAAGLANAVNTAQAGGFDLNGDPGANLFVAPPSATTGAASSMAVQITDPALIAASSDGSAGSNGNITALTSIHDQSIISGQTPTDYYANLVFGVGSDVSNASSELKASELILGQLQNERSSISGVSLDEEATNLIQYQRAYEAAARVVSTVNDILDTTINLGRY